MRPSRLALQLSLLLSACSLIGPEDVEDQELDRLERNQQLWETTEPARYAFIMQRVCFCGTEVTQRVRVEVANGSVVSRTYIDSGNQPVPAQWRDLFPPMEGVFQILREALEREAAEFDAQYDPDRGYPRTVAIDYVKNAVDEELTLRIVGFSVE